MGTSYTDPNPLAALVLEFGCPQEGLKLREWNSWSQVGDLSRHPHTSLSLSKYIYIYLMILLYYITFLDSLHDHPTSYSFGCCFAPELLVLPAAPLPFSCTQKNAPRQPKIMRLRMLLPFILLSSCLLVTCQECGPIWVGGTETCWSSYSIDIWRSTGVAES